MLQVYQQDWCSGNTPLVYISDHLSAILSFWYQGMLKASQLTGWVVLGVTFIVSLPRATVMETLLSRMPTLARNSDYNFPLEFSVLCFIEEF